MTPKTVGTGGFVQKQECPGWLDRPVQALNIVLLAFVMIQMQRKVPLSFAFGEQVRDDTKTRTPGWLARLLPCYSSVGSDWFTSLVPADLLNCLGPHRYGPLRALLTGPEPDLRALFPILEARSLTFLLG